MTTVMLGIAFYNSTYFIFNVFSESYVHIFSFQKTPKEEVTYYESSDFGLIISVLVAAPSDCGGSATAIVPPLY